MSRQRSRDKAMRITWLMGGGALLVAALLVTQGAPAYAAFAMAIDKFDSANEEGVYSYRMPRIAAGPCVLSHAIMDTTSQRITGIATGPPHAAYRMSLSLYFFDETLQVRNASIPQPSVVVASANGSLATSLARHVVVPRGDYDVFVLLKCRYVTGWRPRG